FLLDSFMCNNCVLSLHDALPIFKYHKAIRRYGLHNGKNRTDLHGGGTKLTLTKQQRHTAQANDIPLSRVRQRISQGWHVDKATTDRKSTRLNSSHVSISYAVFCL